MNKNHEVELRVLLKTGQAKALFEKLRKLRAKQISKKKIVDFYYCKKPAKTYDDIKMLAVGSYGLRLRQTIVADKETNELNVKIITRHADHHAWQEHETEIKDFLEMERILDAIGFKSFIKIEKVRTSYRVASLVLNFEDIKDFGKAIEVEMMSTHEGAPKAKTKLKKFLKTLGIDERQILPQSINSLIMKEKSIF